MIRKMGLMNDRQKSSLKRNIIQVKIYLKKWKSVNLLNCIKEVKKK